MKTLLEELLVDSAIAPQDIGTADITSAYFDVRDCERFVAQARAGAVTAAKKLTVQLLQAQDAAGTGSKNLGAAVEAVGAGGNAPAAVTIEKRNTDLDADGGFGFVAIKVGIDEDAKLGAATLLRGRRRYAP
jgi:hypothetical protein